MPPTAHLDQEIMLAMSHENEHAVPTLRADSCMYNSSTDSSSLASSESDSSDSDQGDSTKSVRTTVLMSSLAAGAAVVEPPLSWSKKLAWSVAGILCGGAVLEFSLMFPFVMAPNAATWTYHAAYYNYDPTTSHFDNTIWTYGTDYFLAVVTTGLAWNLWRTQQPQSNHSSSLTTTKTTTISNSLCRRSAALLFTYAISVLAGGLAHQFYTTLDSRNTWSFRLLWTICVGTVTAASCSMGMSATEVIRKFRHYHSQQQQQQNVKSSSSSSPSSLWLHYIPHVPETFWMSFGLTLTAAVIFGSMSYQRPACDIFIAGTTQTPSSAMLMAFFLLVPTSSSCSSSSSTTTTTTTTLITKFSKLMGFAGFILNAPLLPAYPLLVQYTNLSLGAVNTLLHANLCIAWSIQGLSMLHISRALQQLDQIMMSASTSSSSSNHQEGNKHKVQ